MADETTPQTPPNELLTPAQPPQAQPGEVVGPQQYAGEDELPPAPGEHDASMQVARDGMPGFEATPGDMGTAAQNIGGVAASEGVRQIEVKDADQGESIISNPPGSASLEPAQPNQYEGNEGHPIGAEPEESNRDNRDSDSPRENKALAHEMFNAEYPLQKMIDNLKGGGDFPGKQELMLALADEADVLAEKARLSLLQGDVGQSRILKEAKEKDFAKRAKTVLDEVVSKTLAMAQSGYDELRLIQFNEGRALNGFESPYGSGLEVFSEDDVARLRHQIYALFGVREPAYSAFEFKAVPTYSKTYLTNIDHYIAEVVTPSTFAEDIVLVENREKLVKTDPPGRDIVVYYLKKVRPQNETQESVAA